MRRAGTGDGPGVLFIVCGRFPEWHSCKGGSTFLGHAFGITYLPAADQGSSSAGQEKHRAESATAHWRANHGQSRLASQHRIPQL